VRTIIDARRARAGKHIWLDTALRSVLCGALVE
jgi:hypothetical protein